MLVASAGAGGAITIAYLLLIVFAFYFFLIRPQNKQKKEREAMMRSLSVGDDIYTVGGILGTITRIKDNTIWMRISEKCEIELMKSSIGGVQKKDAPAEK
ncbi:MAG: preprotein translocase subunit YajC [Firmicutes bacterium]|nr:preprotein translocase subunit YajC [Bacillota bacterium]